MNGVDIDDFLDDDIVNIVKTGIDVRNFIPSSYVGKVVLQGNDACDVINTNNVKVLEADMGFCDGCDDYNRNV